MRLSTLILAGLLAVVGGEASAVPDCVTAALSGEAGRNATTAAPSITPATGGPGTPVRVEGRGLPIGSDVMIAAVYGDRGCTIVGLGDQLLGVTRVDPDGTYRMERPWPATFTPLSGRGSFDPTPLPDGRYYVIALPCSRPTECSLVDASEAGGPFTQGRRTGNESDGATTGLPVGSAAGAGLGAAIILAGVLFLRRLVR